MAKIYTTSAGKFKEQNMEEIRQLGRDLIEKANQHFTGKTPTMRSQSMTSQSSTEDGQVRTIDYARSVLVSISHFQFHKLAKMEEIISLNWSVAF